MGQVPYLTVAHQQQQLRSKVNAHPYHLKYKCSSPLAILNTNVVAVCVVHLHMPAPSKCSTATLHYITPVSLIWCRDKRNVFLVLKNKVQSCKEVAQ